MIRVALIPGDGVGPEVVREAARVLAAVDRADLADVEMEEFPHGAEHFLATGETLGDEAFYRLRDDFDAILLGAVGDHRVPDGRHARDILLGLRFRLDLYVNYRPARLRLPHLSPLRSGDTTPIDFVIFRENTEGLYFGAGRTEGEGTADEMAVSEAVATRFGVERIVRAAFDHARETGRSRVTLGDILSDLAAELTGGMGLAPSANLHPGRGALYEPVHGSAPDLAGKGEANPMAAILSAALLLECAGAAAAAARVDEIVTEALRAGVCTPDVGGTSRTSEVGSWIAQRMASA